MEEAPSPKERLGPTLHRGHPQDALKATQEASRPQNECLRELTSKKGDVQEGPTKCSLVLFVV